MTTIIANTFSEEDLQLIEAHQLGTPLHIYRLKPGNIRFMRWTARIILLFGFIDLALVIYKIFSQRVQFTSTFPDSLELIHSLLGLLNIFLLGGLSYPLMLRRARSKRIIVCEHGMLQIVKKIRSNTVEVVRWYDITAIIEKIYHRDYVIHCRGETSSVKTFWLSHEYEKLDELADFIIGRCEGFADIERDPLA